MFLGGSERGKEEEMMSRGSVLVWLVGFDSVEGYSQVNSVSLDGLAGILNVYILEVGCLLLIILAPNAMNGVLRQF